MATTNTAAIATTQTTVQTSNFIVTPVLSDNVKDAWNKLIGDLRGSGVINEAVADIREGVNEMTADLKTDIQATVASIEKSMHQEFAAFKTTSSEGLSGLAKSAYIQVMDNAEKSLTTITSEATADFWKETDDFSKSLNAILDVALKDSKLDINKLSTQVFDSLKTEFNDLVNEMKDNITSNYQKAIVNIGLAAGAAGLVVTKEQLTQFENNVVSAVSVDVVIGATKIGVDMTAEFFEMSADLSNTVIKNKDSLLKILVIDGVNLVQAAATTAWKAVKKWFKW